MNCIAIPGTMNAKVNQYGWQMLKEEYWPVKQQIILEQELIHTMPKDGVTWFTKSHQHKIK